MSYGGEAEIGFSTARGRDWPSVRQFSVFLENRVGVLLDLVRKFEASNNRIVAMTVVENADCAVIRLILRNPERAKEIFELSRLPVIESDLLVVQLPEVSQPLSVICQTLLAAELNIHYAYPLMLPPRNIPALAIHIDDLETAIATLQSQGYGVLTERDLEE
ncbi:MAG: acetolactate synthase [Gemmatales bacterium]|nr:acetolactate synthase [Gemmatales bacterium]MDW8386657.1 acetolactate synthase [Gemmatales bacterium]